MKVSGPLVAYVLAASIVALTSSSPPKDVAFNQIKVSTNGNHDRPTIHWRKFPADFRISDQIEFFTDWLEESINDSQWIKIIEHDR